MDTLATPMHPRVVRDTTAPLPVMAAACGLALAAGCGALVALGTVHTWEWAARHIDHLLGGNR